MPDPLYALGMSTVQLDATLFREVERLAADTRRSVESVVDEAVRAALARVAHQPAQRVVLPTFGGSGTQPGVDISNSARLLDIMESGE